MNFTREPIIETVITPKEGCKLIVRNSKGAGQEDYFVDAIEIVSFGSALFYRSLERPKSFLVPVTDYEVLELKETKLVLKNVGLEKSIKIGGGKEAPKIIEGEQKKRDKKRPKKRRGKEEGYERPYPIEGKTLEEKGGDTNDETSEVSSSIVRRLIPPPSTLIKEKLSRIKEEMVEEDISEEIKKSPPPQKEQPQENKTPTEPPQAEPPQAEPPQMEPPQAESPEKSSPPDEEKE